MNRTARNRPWLGRTLGGLAAALLASGFALRGAPGAPPQSPAGPIDLLLITIDTLRADAPGFGGHRPSPTPVLDRLAAAGRVFVNAHAHNVVTLPSHTNILTGVYPFQHGVRDNEGFILGTNVPTLATVLHAAGYATGAFVGAYPLDSHFGLGRGFDVYDDHYPKGGNNDQFLFAERKGDRVVAPALRWWQEHRGHRRFLWVHLYDPHAPYEPAEPYASRFPKDPYLGEVAAADGYLEPLLAPFLAGHETPTLIVVTGDHGESLGEHGELTHGLFAYESTLHVPLLVWGPSVAPGRDERAARHVDIFPTMVAAAGLTGAHTPATPAGLERPGSSLLLPPATGTRGSSYFEAISATFNRGWAPLRGMLDQGQKAIALPLPELYNLPRDPGEAHNLADAERRALQALLVRLPTSSAWPPTRGPVSAAEEANLRSLGYVSGTALKTQTFGPADDPKNLVAVDNQIHQIIDLYQRGHAAQAADLAQAVVKERPTMPLGYSLLAQSLLEAGRQREALIAMQEAVKRGLASDSLLCQLGLTLAEVGRTQEAVAVLRPLAGRGDPRYLEALAQALSDAEQQDEAERAIERALALEPDDAGAYEIQAMIGLRTRRWDAARGSADRALALNDHLPRAWNDLGVALFQLGERTKALDAWQRAVDLDGSLLDALWNLGTRATELGRPDQARRALARYLDRASPAEHAADRAEARRLLERLGSGSQLPDRPPGS